MFYDYSKRDYLLPNGCKDLIDVLKLKQFDTVPSFEDFLSLCDPKHFAEIPKPPIGGEIVVGEQITVRELALLLDLKPFKIIADLMDLKVLATVNDALDFATICKVAVKYGFTVKKAA